MQVGMSWPKSGVRNNPHAELRIAELLSAWRNAKVRVVHVRHISRTPRSPFWPGQEGVEFQEARAPLESENIVEKNVPDAFINTGLERWLHARGVNELVIVSVSTNNSVEAVEAEKGSMHYQFKVHTITNSPYQLATHPSMLDVVEQLLGPDILLYSVSYIIKEPNTDSHVSWHQDLSYWGLSADDQVSAWLALSPATEESGCMLMLPGSHHQGRREHQLMNDDSNVLLSSQTIPDVDESLARAIPLQPGEASFHHGWTMHTSKPNRSNDRRIGLNIQYIAPHVRQLKAEDDSAILVRGEDRYQHFKTDTPAQKRFDAVAWG